MNILKSLILHGVQALGYNIERKETQDAYPILRSIDRRGLEVLAEKPFQQSCRMLGDATLLDTPRLANLWMLCRLTDEAGAMAEIGTYRGGGALHLSNCCPERELIVCDPLDQNSFEDLDHQKDQLFHHGEFSNTSKERVERLLQGRKARIIQGYFPASAATATLPKLSFVHLDVDVYKATKESLLFLLTKSCLCAKSLIVIDDYNRGAEGVNSAVQEVVSEIKGTLAFPLFPGQALVVPMSWYQ